MESGLMTLMYYNKKPPTILLNFECKWQELCALCTAHKNLLCQIKKTCCCYCHPIVFTSLPVVRIIYFRTILFLHKNIKMLFETVKPELTTACLQRQPFWSLNLSLYNIELPLNNDYLSTWDPVHNFDFSCDNHTAKLGSFNLS